MRSEVMCTVDGLWGRPSKLVEAKGDKRVDVFIVVKTCNGKSLSLFRGTGEHLMRKGQSLR